MSIKKWTLDSLKKEALKYKSKVEFRKGNPAAHSAARKRADYDYICCHMKKLRKAWSIEKIEEEALKYKNRAAFKENCPSAYNAAKKLKILNKACSHMKIRWKRKWSISSITSEALKYTNRNDFVLLSSGAYSAAKKLNIFEKVTAHMGSIYIKWNIDNIFKEALRYSSRDVFKKQSNKAYDAAVKRGILEEVCSHMKYATNTSSSEADLFSIIKDRFPKTQKLVDRKAKIKNKPYIRGFDIDIYIPELRKGIEFDGTYYHSIKGLKRGRPSWTEEDLVNYHQIKDEYFRSKGIELLHIKEKDWLVDKETCLKKIFLFLK